MDYVVNLLFSGLDKVQNGGDMSDGMEDIYMWIIRYLQVVTNYLVNLLFTGPDKV